MPDTGFAESLGSCTSLGTAAKAGDAINAAEAAIRFLRIILTPTLAIFPGDHGCHIVCMGSGES